MRAHPLFATSVLLSWLCFGVYLTVGLSIVTLWAQVAEVADEEVLDFDAEIQRIKKELALAQSPDC